MQLLIKNGLVIDPASRRELRADVLVRGGRVVRVSPRLSAPSAEVYDASGKWVFPGFIDLHVHAREPGAERSETIASAARAAAAGGVTSVLLMPNTSPPMDSPARLRRYAARAERAAVNVYFSAAVTAGRGGVRLGPLAALRAAGALAFTDDGACVSDDRLLEAALRECRRLRRPLLDHPELPGLPGPEAETFAALRDILATRGRYPVHLQHLSLAASLAALALGKRCGLPVTGETCPHYFALTAADARRGGTDFKMNPPLRAAADRAAVLRALADGTLDAIATDHAPHERRLKARPWELAPNGVIGLETLAPLCVTELVLNRRVTRLRLAELLSANPARLLGLRRKGALAPGRDADITVLDPGAARRVPARFVSLSSNSPFKGRLLRGWACATVVRGRFVFRDGKFC